MTGTVNISIVSHGHGAMVMAALQSLASGCRQDGPAMVIWLTLNLSEPELRGAIQEHDWPFSVTLIENAQPLGFGANHNQAFARSGCANGSGDWFVVMNPDIFWPQEAHGFWQGLAQSWPADVGLLCPLQVDVAGQRQDFARHLMTPWGMVWRVLRRALGAAPSGVASSVAQADWVNGACMVWRAQAFEAVGGFDDRYFMYCEDTDICLRMRLAGWRMCEAPLTVVHDARRHTGRSWLHLRWHLSSMLRLWSSSAFWRYSLGLWAAQR